MLKFFNYDVVFQEVPDQVSLALWLTGCRIRCPACNQRELWEDKGTPLTIEIIEEILNNERGVTCLTLLGGEHDIDTLIEIFMHFHKKIKTAWYCGLDMIPKDKIGILQYLDVVKVGHFDIELGGLDSPTTNQRLYRVEHKGNEEPQLNDITYLMQKK